MPPRTMPSTHAQAMWPGDSVFDMSAVVHLVRPVLKADRTDTEAPARPWWPSVGWPGAPVKFHPAFFCSVHQVGEVCPCGVVLRVKERRDGHIVVWAVGACEAAVSAMVEGHVQLWRACRI